MVKLSEILEHLIKLAKQDIEVGALTDTSEGDEVFVAICADCRKTHGCDNCVFYLGYDELDSLKPQIEQLKLLELTDD